MRTLGPDPTWAASGRRSTAAIETLQIDTRAQGEVRRLSGGNQQKVTIARWVAGGVKTMLCFDPTRGIDIRTKHQIYVLLRDLAEAGAAVLLYTSELKEIQLACDRAIVIFGGRVVAEIDGRRRRRAARSCAPPTTCSRTRSMPGARGGRGRRADADRRSRRRGRRRADDRAATTAGERRDGPVARALARGRARATPGPSACSGSSSCCSRSRKLIQPSYGVTGIQGLAISVLPLALAAVAQAIVVISGGIDLSIGSMMALTSVVAAVADEGPAARSSASPSSSACWSSGLAARRHQRRP